MCSSISIIHRPHRRRINDEGIGGGVARRRRWVIWNRHFLSINLELSPFICIDEMLEFARQLIRDRAHMRGFYRKLLYLMFSVIG